jgi:hypothetical protein
VTGLSRPAFGATFPILVSPTGLEPALERF